MAQAKRKTRRKTRQSSRGGRPVFSGGLGTLITGIVIGAVGSALYFGINNNGTAPLGDGLKNLWEVTREQRQSIDAKQEEAPDPPKPPAAKFDFYTILPEIERVIPDNYQPEIQPERNSEPEQQEGITYMLQAGSYANFKDADRVKAQLALTGLSAHIQKVAIEGRGTFHRVRLGPFVNLGNLREVNARLKKQGIEAIRLKISG